MSESKKEPVGGLVGLKIERIILDDPQHDGGEDLTAKRRRIGDWISKPLEISSDKPATIRTIGHAYSLEELRSDPAFRKRCPHGVMTTFDVCWICGRGE